MLKPVEGADRRVRVDPDGTLHLPAGCELLTNLYANHGVRVRLVRRPPPAPAPSRRDKAPSVRQLIDQLAKKQHRLLSPPSDPDLVSKSSSSARTVPLLSPQGVYGSGDFRAGPSSSQPPGGDVGGWDPRHTSDLHKLRELELHGNGCRTRSRNGSCRREKVPFNRCHEEIGALVPTITGCKPPTVRGNGIRKDLLGHPSHGVAGSEEDVAMGTLWSSSHHRQTRNTTITTSSSTSFISNKSLPISVGSGSSVALTSGSGSGTPLPATAVAARRSVGGSTSNTFQSLSQQQTSPWAPSSFAMGNIVKSNKEADPKYSDPVLGAPPSFQQRLVELAALEAETVRWERSKKVKKKPLKQDKDS